MIRIRHLGIMYLALAAGILVACVEDPIADPPAPPGDDGTRELRLNVVVPDNTTAGATRAITPTEENTIQTVDVLAFRVDGANETYDYAVTATLAPNSISGAATQTFVANLRIQPWQQRFVVITNARQQVQSVTTGATQGTAKATLLSQLRFDLATGTNQWQVQSPSNYAALPMWGESQPETVTSTTRNLASTIPLLRMLARMDVRLDTSVAGLAGRFKLRSVAVYNINRGGRIVPDAANVTTTQEPGGSYVRATRPTIPTNLQPYSARTRGPINYRDFSAPSTVDVSMTGAIYLFETAAATADYEATSIVVGGFYDTDAQQTYYRVDLYAAGTQNRLDILRNCQYIVNITNVRGRGYGTVEEAFNSRAVNMTASVLQWNNPSMDNIVFNGQNYLATDKQQVNLFSNEYTTALVTNDNVVLAITDVPGGWTPGPITNADGTGTALWVRMSPILGGAGVTTRITISADPNNTGAPRTAIVNLEAGRLRLPFRVVQSNQPAIALNIVNPGGQEIQELVFSAPAGVAPASQQFNVTWLPASNPVTVPYASQITRYEFPNPGGNPTANNGAPYLNMPWPERTGSRTFTVAPSALTSAELAADPFIEKSSRIDFQVGNGYTTITKSIRLRQLYYNLLVEPNPFLQPHFPMDGQRYAFNVRSNTTWRIRSVTETPRVAGTRLIAAQTGLDNVYTGALGGPVTTPGGGWREYLTTNGSTRGMSGYADVTYESDKTPVQFQPVTRRLFFPAAQFNIFSICLMNTNNPDPRTYSFWSGNAPSTPPYTDRDVHNMVNGPGNYGSSTTGSGMSEAFSAIVPVRGIGTYGLWAGGSSSGASNGNSYSGTTVTVDMINAAVAANADMLVISGDAVIPWTSGGANPEAQAIYDNFLARDKPVLLFTNISTSVLGLFVAAHNAGRISGDMSGSNGLNGAAPVYTYGDFADPILDGPFIPANPNNPSQPFTSMRGRRWGSDGGPAGSGGTPGWWFSNPANNNVIIYSNLVNSRATQSAVPPGNSTPNGNAPTPANGASSFRFANVPLFVSAGGGWLGSVVQSGNTTNYPIQVNPSSKVPEAKSWGDFWCYNSYMLANAVAWAIQRRTVQ